MYTLLDVLVSCFNNPIHLRPVGRRVMMLYIELLAELSDHCIVEICTIVHNDPLWYTISKDQIVPNKPCHDVLGYCSKGSCLNPLCKIINGYQNEAIPVRRSRSDLANHVDTPHCKGPRCYQNI